MTLLNLLTLTTLVQVLVAYRGYISSLEQQIISSANVTLSSLLYHLQPFLILLPPLQDLLTRLSARFRIAQTGSPQSPQNDPSNPRGQASNAELVGSENEQGKVRVTCVVLDELARHVQGSGVASVKSMFSRLLAHCRQVLLFQIVSWTVGGRTNDSQREFFIQPSSHPQSSYPGTAASLGEFSSTMAERERESGRNNKDHVLLAELVPVSVLSLATATKICFIGNAIRLLQANEDAHNTHVSRSTSVAQTSVSDETHETSLSLSLSRDRPRVKETDRSDLSGLKLELKTVGNHIYNLGRLGDSATGGEREQETTGDASGAWADLTCQQLHTGDLDALIDAQQTAVNRRLWRLVMQEGQLLNHLKALKDYYLLGRGDFYHSFLTLVSS